MIRSPIIRLMTFKFPVPELIQPNSVTAFRWGVMGAAEIASAFVAGVQKHTSQQVVAVASKTPGKAEAFASKFGIESHDNYEDLLAREDIDIVYIPTLPSQHKDHALQAITAGKHVLIEKPLTLVPSEAREIFDAAKKAGVLAMEAMWTRYLPQYDLIRQILDADTLGHIEVVNVSMCQANLEVPRLWKKNHGDPLFDMGIYPISFCQTFLGNPTKITAQGVLNSDGVDEEISVQLSYATGARAYVLVSARAAIPGIAQISGTKAKLDVGPEFFIPSTLELRSTDFNSQPTTWADKSHVVGHEGLSYQATAMASFIDQGLLESPYESHSDSIANLEVCAEIIRLVGASIH